MVTVTMVTFVTDLWIVELFWVYTKRMNARDYKLFRAGHVYHVYNRGDNRELVFLDDQDYFSFLRRIKVILSIVPIPNRGQRGSWRLKPLPQGSFSILAYCLMPNHFHFMIRQNTNLPISDFIHKLCTSYAKYFNKKYERLGNLFQDTFKAKLVENDVYALYLSAYIHNNPETPANYPYSSFLDYAEQRKGVICDKTFLIEYCKQNKVNYSSFVNSFTDAKAKDIKSLLFEE